MKRDMDMVRDLLLKIEGGQRRFDIITPEIAAALGAPADRSIPREEADKLSGHLDLLSQAGYLTEGTRYGGGVYYADGLTWEGHEFLDTLRDPDRWQQTKGAAAKVGGVGLKAMVEIGKAIAKGELQKLGIPLG